MYSENGLEALADHCVRQKPGLLPGFFAERPIGNAEIMEVLRRFCASQKGEISSTLRVFQGGRREELEYRLVESQPSIVDQPEDWFYDTFGNCGTAILLNRVERWSVPVANLAALIGNALMTNIEKDDVEAVLLMGDYGYTPFGVHKDDDGTRIVHVPLTSTEKVMHLWTEEEFLKVSGGAQRFYEPARIIETSSQFRYCANDLFYLPPRHYHVGYSPEFTASLVITLTERSKTCPLFESPKVLAARFGKNWNQKEAVQSMALSKLVKMTEQYTSLSRMSNCGLKAELAPEISPLSVHPEKFYSLTHPFKVFYDVFGDLLLYLRGKTVWFSAKLGGLYLSDICSLMELFNARHALSVKLAAKLAKSLHEDAVMGLFELLAGHQMLTPAS